MMEKKTQSERNSWRNTGMKRKKKEKIRDTSMVVQAEGQGVDSSSLFSLGESSSPFKIR